MLRRQVGDLRGRIRDALDLDRGLSRGDDLPVALDGDGAGQGRVTGLGGGWVARLRGAVKEVRDA
nr:hypothetical protein [Microbacterium barkeri]